MDKKEIMRDYNLTEDEYNDFESFIQETLDDDPDYYDDIDEWCNREANKYYRELENESKFKARNEVQPSLIDALSQIQIDKKPEAKFRDLGKDFSYGISRGLDLYQESQNHINNNIDTTMPEKTLNSVLGGVSGDPDYDFDEEDDDYEIDR